MRIEKRFIRNYLSQAPNSRGLDAVLVALGLCLLLSWVYWSNVLGLASSLSASYSSVFVKGDLWRLFTTTFVHADLKHLLSNSLMLGFLTFFVASFYGFFMSVAISFLAAIITNALVLVIYGGDTILVGASGVVYYLWGFWMILYMCLQRQHTFINRALRMGAVFLVLLVPTEYQPSTSYLAHYIGFALGISVGFIYYFISKSKLLSKERWSIKEVNDDLTDLDIIALTYPLIDNYDEAAAVLASHRLNR